MPSTSSGVVNVTAEKVETTANRMSKKRRRRPTQELVSHSEVGNLTF